MKKFLLFLLSICCLFTLVGCGDECSLNVEIIEKVYVNESSKYVVKVMPDDIEISDYSYESSDTKVLTVNEGTITGVKSGKAELIINVTYKKQALEKKIEVTVEDKKVEIDYQLISEIPDTMIIGNNESITVKEKETNTTITDFEVFFDKEGILEYKDNELIPVGAGNVTMIIATTFLGKEIKLEKSITIEEPKKVYSLDVTLISEMNVGDESSIIVKETTTNTTITDFDLTISNESIVSYTNGMIKALKAGTVNVEISCVYDGQELKVNKDILVIEKNKNYSLIIDVDTDLIAGNETSVVIKEKTTNTVITDYQYTISNETVIKLVNDKIVALDKGESTFSVSAEFDGINLSAEITITVTKKDDVEITCNIPLTAFSGQTFTVEVLIKENNTPVDSFTFISVNDDISYYEEDTKFFEVFDVGTTLIQITAVYNNNTYKLEYEVNVLAGFDLIIEAKSELMEKDTEEVKVFISPLNIEVTDFTLSSNNDKIISCDKNTIIASGMGKARITVRTTYMGIDLVKTMEINVLELIPNSLEANLYGYMFINEEKKIDVKVFPSYDTITDYQVTTSDENTISYADGILKAKKIGSCTISIKAQYHGEELTLTKEMNVNNFSSITLDVKDDLKVNEVSEIKVFVNPDNVQVKDFTYTTSDNELLLVNKDACFARNEGKVKLTVSYTYLGTEYSQEQEINISKITHDIERIYLTGSIGILENTSIKLTLSTYPEKEGLQDIIVTSTDTNVATCDSGTLEKKDTVINVTAVGTGKCQIIVKLKDNEAIKTIHDITVVNKNETSVVEGAIGDTPYCGKYYEDSIFHYYELMNDIIETSYIGYTSTITPGIDADGYSGLNEPIVTGQYYPQHVHTLTVPSTTNTKIIPWANLNGHVWTLTSVRGLIEDFEKKNPQYKVIAAVNGDFFDINANGNLPYQTTGENISNGEFYKTTNSFGESGGTVGFTNNGTTKSLIASNNAQRTPYMLLAIYDDNGNIIKEFNVNNLNTEPNENESSVYFGTYNSDKQYVPQELSTTNNCYVVQNAELALPNNSTDFYGLGTISSLEPQALTKGSFAIVSKDTEVINALSVGTRIRCQYEYIDDFAQVTSSTGYNRVVYNDVNQLQDYIGDRAPRTVIGMKADGTLVMMVVDGRQGYDSMYGCDGTELAAIMKANDCICAYNLDGGGSSTIVVRDEKGLHVLNSPSDGRERSDGNCLLIVSVDPNYKSEVTNITSTQATIKVKTEVEEYKNYTPYIMFEKELYEVVNDQITLNGLVHNTTYSYQVYYKDNNGDYYSTLTVGSFKTGKGDFTFLGIILEESDTEYIFNVYYDDIDNNSDLASMKINLNGFEVYCNDGKAILQKSIFGKVIESLSFEYRYYKDGVLTRVVLDDYTYYHIKK